MRHRVRALLALALLGTAAMAATPAWADPRRASGPPPSVFPAPRDQWRSWGVHTELPRHLPPPRQHHYGYYGGQGHVPPSVFVPGQWVWDGHYSQWVWAPGYWRRY
jgi:hypothetical protein